MYSQGYFGFLRTYHCPEWPYPRCLIMEEHFFALGPLRRIIYIWLWMDFDYLPVMHFYIDGLD